MRAEAEAPFRTLRLVLFGFSAASAAVGLLISLPQLIGALGGARGALAVDDVAVNIAVNAGAAATFGFLFRNDWRAREKQIARLTRESALADQRVRLANGKRVALRELQGNSRCVLVAGTPAQVAASLAEAEQYRDALEKRGVFVVALPIFEAGASSGGAASSSGSGSSGDASSSGGSGSGGGAAAAAAPAALLPLQKADLRWRGEAEGLQGYRRWFEDQLRLTPAKVTANTGLYVGLRLDGRVRASGEDARVGGDWRAGRGRGKGALPLEGSVQYELARRSSELSPLTPPRTAPKSNVCARHGRRAVGALRRGARAARGRRQVGGRDVGLRRRLGAAVRTDGRPTDGRTATA